MEQESLNLCKVLEKIGVKDVVRKWLKEAADSFDELEFLQYDLFGQLPSSFCPATTVGSFSEGTFRSSCNSDRDILIFLEDIEVKETEDAETSGTCNYADMLYIDSKPGFVHLSIKPNCDEKLYKDLNIHVLSSGRKLIHHHNYQEGILNLMKNGPANTSRLIFCEHDVVFCYKCPWPRPAKEWLERPRIHGWPSADTISHLQTLQCCVVRTGHPHSKEEDRCLEWRLSFTIQENHLMCNLTDVQFKSFVLLKMIKEDLVTLRLGKSLTSYHCKTALFYTIEGNPQTIWQPMNLLHCLVLCLRQLKQWAEAEFCPSYFMPQADLFPGKVEGDTIKHLAEILDEILSDPVANLKRLTRSNFGRLFQIALTEDKEDTPEFLDLQKDARNEMVQLVHGFIVIMNLAVENVLDFCLLEIEKISRATNNVVQAYSIVIAKQVHFYNDLKTVIGKLGLKCHIVPVLKAGLASQLVAMAVDTSDMVLRDWLLCAAAITFEQAFKGEEGVVVNLKLASVLYITGHIHSAKKVLEDVRIDLDLRKMSMMSKGEAEKTPIHEMLGDALQKMANIDPDSMFTFPAYMFFKRFSFRLVVFLKSESAVTPKGLLFEAYRSIATEPNSRLEVDFWFDRSHIDAVSFYQALNYMVEGKKDITLLFDHLDMIPPGFHYPYMNLLGWLAKEEGDIMVAAFSFIRSWQENLETAERLHEKHKIDFPEKYHHHNAAKLHMLLLIYELWKDRQTES